MPDTAPMGKPPGRVRAVVRNLGIAAQVSAAHIVDDPMALLLLASRVAPSAVVKPPARLALRIPGLRGSWVGALADAVLGHIDALERRIDAALARPKGVAKLCTLADIALALERSDLAEKALAGVPEGSQHRRFRAVSARKAGFDGHLTEAAGYATADGAGTAMARRHLGQLMVFQGEPLKPPRVGRPYRPVEGRVLHMLTNSLPHSPSGYPQRSHSVLLAQRELGLDVRAVTRVGYPVMVGQLLARDVDTVDGIAYHRILPAKHPGDQHSALQYQVRAMAARIREFRPEVLHTTTHFVNALVARPLSEAFGIPWVYEVRGQLANTWLSRHGEAARDSEKYRLFLEREAEAARSADAIVTLGEAMRASLVADGVDPARITLCPNAVGEQFLHEPLSKREARLRLGLDPNARYVGAVSSLVHYEGHDDLLRAFVDLRRRFPGLKLLLVGNGSSAAYLHRLAASLDIDDDAIFPGLVPRSQAHLWHQALDAFVVPRKDYEVTRNVTPLKPVEAAASARPVVASRLPALAEVVRDGETGLLTPADDPAALGEALALLLADPERADALGAAGRAWALADRTWAANAARYRDLYRTLAG